MPGERRVDHVRREDTSEIARREVMKVLEETEPPHPPPRFMQPRVLLLALVTALLFAASVFLANVALFTTLRSATAQIDQLETQIDELRSEVTVLRAQVRELGGEPRRPDGDGQ